MLTLGVIKSPWCTHQAMRAIVIKIIDQPRKIREFGRAVTYPGRLGARYTGLGAQTLAPKKGFLTFYLKIFFKHPRRRVFRYSIYVI